MGRRIPGNHTDGIVAGCAVDERCTGFPDDCLLHTIKGHWPTGSDDEGPRVRLRARKEGEGHNSGQIHFDRIPGWPAHRIATINEDRDRCGCNLKKIGTLVSKHREGFYPRKVNRLEGPAGESLDRGARHDNPFIRSSRPDQQAIIRTWAAGNVHSVFYAVKPDIQSIMTLLEPARL